jgi:multidrug resistance efflux pump
MVGTRTTGLVASLAAVLAVGCSSGIPAPTDQYAAAQADVGRAQAGGAPGVPDARLHLQLAQEDLQRCKQLMGNDNDRALTLSAVAASEAELALALARQSEARNQLQAVQDELQKTVRPQ